MDVKKVFKPDMKKITITAILFVVMIAFLLPVKMNVLCKPGSPCPPVNAVITFPEMSANPRFLEINYLFVGAELIIAYVLASLGVYFLSWGKIKNKKKKQ